MSSRVPLEVKANEIKMMDMRGYDLKQIVHQGVIHPYDLSPVLKNGTAFLVNLQAQGMFSTKSDFQGIYVKRGDPTDKVRTLYPENDPDEKFGRKPKKVKVPQATQLVKLLRQTTAVNPVEKISYIVISAFGLGSTRATFIKLIKTTKIEEFTYMELAAPVMTHAFGATQWNVVKAKNVAALEKSEGLVYQNLPVIRENDAFSRRLALTSGDVLISSNIGTYGDSEILYQRVASERDMNG